MSASSLGGQPQSELLKIDAETFRANFNRRPFLVRHRLADHPLFTLPSLIELSKRLPAEYVKYSSGDVSVDVGLYRGRRTGLSIQETIRQIEQCRSWMVLKFVERDPAYGELMLQCLDEIRHLSEPIDPGMADRESFIFISSAGSITPYHMDPEYNFLLQIRGYKTLYVFDGADRSILPERELEEYCARGFHDITFKEEFQDRAAIFELTPGVGLHVPVMAPHWVQNGDEVSISFSITFRTPASERRAVVHTANAYLRRKGFKPAPFGSFPLRDSAKFHAYRAVRRIKRLLGDSKATPTQY